MLIVTIWGLFDIEKGIFFDTYKRLLSLAHFILILFFILKPHTCRDVWKLYRVLF